MGVEVHELTPDNPGALALLAWHELVELAEKELPLLIVGDKVLTGDQIEGYLSQASRG